MGDLKCSASLHTMLINITMKHYNANNIPDVKGNCAKRICCIILFSSRLKQENIVIVRYLIVLELIASKVYLC